MEISDSILALIAALAGGTGLRLLEKVLNRNKEKTDFAASIRAELRNDKEQLRLELEAVKRELREVENQLDVWRGKYYELLEQFYEKGIKPDQIDPPE